jgi:hypothetical protein
MFDKVRLRVSGGLRSSAPPIARSIDSIHWLSRERTCALSKFWLPSILNVLLGFRPVAMLEIYDVIGAKDTVSKTEQLPPASLLVFVSFDNCHYLLTQRALKPEFPAHPVLCFWS